MRDVASRAGACSLQLPSCTDAGHAQAYASLLSETLGLAVPGAEAQRSSQQAPDSPVDLAVLHLRPRGDAPWSATDADATAACLDGVVSTLRACAAVRQQLYLLLLLGRASSVKAASERDACAAASLPPWLAHLRPHQSYEERLSANEEAECVSRRGACTPCERAAPRPNARSLPMAQRACPSLRARVGRRRSARQCCFCERC